jgi:hypothetical protein
LTGDRPVCQFQHTPLLSANSCIILWYAHTVNSLFILSKYCIMFQQVPEPITQVILNYFSVAHAMHDAAPVITWDPHTEQVNVSGRAYITLINAPTNHMPSSLQWGSVEGQFYVAGMGLKSLKGSPQIIKGTFKAQRNKLKDLREGPRHVEGDFIVASNPLRSLEGAPTHITGRFTLDYHNKLPLLRTLVAQKGVLIYKAPLIVAQILERHAAQGKPGAIRAAAELIKAGYPDNAKW